MPPSLLRILFVSVALIALPAFAADGPTEPGVRWKMSSKVTAMGMSMPPQTFEVCAPASSKEAPMPLDKNCEILSRQSSGDTESAKFRCTGKDAMEGTVEIKHVGPDHYHSKTHMKSADGEMEGETDAQKLPGTCDAGAIKRKVDAMVAQTGAMTAKLCHDGAAAPTVGMFTGSAPTCTDPAAKKTFCSTVQGYRAFKELSFMSRHATDSSQAASQGLEAVAATCGFGVEAVRSKLCAAAESKGEWSFLATECPTLADPIGKRECVGRGYTSPVADKYRTFCTEWSGAQASNDGDSAKGPDGKPADKKSAADKSKEALKKGKDKLKDLFKF
jgi:hypothetical protein